MSDAPAVDSEREMPPAQASVDEPRTALRPLSAAIYGQVVVTSVVAALEVHEPSPPVETLAAVAGTIVVFWAAHVYAEALASAADRYTAARMLAAESTMLAVALPTLFVLGLGALGVLSRAQASAVSVAVGVLTLFALGAVAGWRVGHSPARTIWTAVVGAGFGLVVVALKVLVH